MNQTCRKLKHGEIYYQSCSGNWESSVSSQMIFWRKPRIKNLYVLPHLKNKTKQWHMSIVALYIFRTIIFFSFLSTVLNQSDDNHVLVYCAAYRKWCQINSKLEIRLVRTDTYWQYSFIWICSFLRGLTPVLEYFIIQKYLPS